MVPFADVPKPVGIAALPTDHRGVVISAHVPRAGGVPRIADVDQDRLFILAVERRCTLCGWAFEADERFWYIAWPEPLRLMKESGWTGWDISPEGGAHEECLVYAAIVCPFLTTPAYIRRTDQRAAGTLIHERGSTRPPPTLAGAPNMEVRPSGNAEEPFNILMGGGQFALHQYTEGSELLPVLHERLASQARTPTRADLEIGRLMAEGSEAEISVRAKQTWVVVAAGEGVRLPQLGRNDLCSCGAHAKFKNCCLPRYNAARSAARGRAPFR